MRNVRPPRDLAVESLILIKLGFPPRQNMKRTRLIFSGFAAVRIRKALMHTCFPLCWPFQTSADPPEA